MTPRRVHGPNRPLPAWARVADRLEIAFSVVAVTWLFVDWQVKPLVAAFLAAPVRRLDAALALAWHTSPILCGVVAIGCASLVVGYVRRRAASR